MYNKKKSINKQILFENYKPLFKSKYNYTKQLLNHTLKTNSLLKLKDKFTFTQM